MIHIFDKIYISYAEASVGPNSIARLPESYVRIIDKGLNFMFETIYTKNEIAYEKSLSEVLAKYESDEAFFNVLLNEIKIGNTPKVIMYLDEPAMLEFLIKWWKAIFPNMTAEGGYALYKIFSDSEILRPARSTESFIDITVKSDKATFESFAHNYWSESKQMFMDKFNHYPAFNLPVSITNQCSIEFLIVDYLLNPEEMKPELMNRLTRMYNRQFSIQLHTMVRTLQHKLYYVASEFAELSHAAVLNDQSIKDTLMRDSKFHMLFDFDIQDSSKTLEYIESNYELHKFCQDLIDLEIAITGKQGFDVQTIKSMDPLVGYYADNGQHPNLLDVLMEEINSLGRHKLFNSLLNKNRFNPFIIVAFLNLIKVKGTEDVFVKQFKLAQS